MQQILNLIGALLADVSLTELMWNDFATLFVEREGRLAPAESPFRSADQFGEFIIVLETLATDRGGLAFDGMLPDGSRFHVTTAALSPMGPTLTIRKFARAHHGLESLVRSGFLTPESSHFLRAAVRARLNILISGGTGAGKTTLLNALLSDVRRVERVLTVEDVAEIRLDHPNWLRLVAQKRAGGTVRECLVGALRMRPDRIVVGECRSDETLEMLQMMNTGHDGGFSTLHANSAHEALVRVESLILFHARVEIPLRALRRQITDAIDLIVHVGKSSTGQRSVREILEIGGMEGDVITRMPVFAIDPRKGGDRLTPTGFVPRLRVA